MPSSNDYHYEVINGEHVMLPGLGADEPDEKMRSKMDKDAAVLRAQRVELVELEMKIKGQAADFEQREKTMTDKEAEIEERTRGLELEKAALEQRLRDLESKERGGNVPPASAR